VTTAVDDDDDDDDDDNDNNYLVPIVFHNMSAYDGHFVLRFFLKEYTKYTTRQGKTAYADVGVIPLNGERNLLLKIGNIVFVDSCQFLAASLDAQVGPAGRVRAYDASLRSKRTLPKEG